MFIGGYHQYNSEGKIVEFANIKSSYKIYKCHYKVYRIKCRYNRLRGDLQVSLFQLTSLLELMLNSND